MISYRIVRKQCEKFYKYQYGIFLKIEMTGSIQSDIQRQNIDGSICIKSIWKKFQPTFSSKTLLKYSYS